MPFAESSSATLSPEETANDLPTFGLRFLQKSSIPPYPFQDEIDNFEFRPKKEEFMSIYLCAFYYYDSDRGQHYKVSKPYFLPSFETCV